MRESHKIVAKRVGRKLKELRGFETQQEYARGLGCSQAQYNRYETGKRLAPDGLLEAAAAQQGISPELLLWGGPPSPEEEGRSEFCQAVARLVGLMNAREREDIYLYLRRKAKMSRQAELERAAKAMEESFLRAG